MSDLAAFARSCRDTSRQLRRLPADLRKDIASDVQTRVAEPLAGEVADAFTGPWANPLAISTKARKLADPTIIIGGSRRVVSGGASPRQLVYGNEFGGGSRVATVRRKSAKPYKAHTTRQFHGRQGSIFRTIRGAGWVLDEFASIVIEKMARVING